MVTKKRDDEGPEETASQSAPPLAQSTDSDIHNALSGETAIRKAHLEWAHAIKAAWLNYRTRWLELTVDMNNTQNNERASASKPMQDAYAELQRVQATTSWNQQNQEQYQNAWQAFQSASEDFNSNTCPALQQTLSHLQETCAQKHQDLLAKTHEACRDAYQKYLDGLKAVWQEIPGTNVDSNTLHLLAWATTQAAMWQPPKA